MGTSKQLLPVNGRPAVRVCAETIIAAGIRDIVVVLGPNGAEVAAALEGLPVRIVHNPDPRSDMAGSARVGFAAISPAGTSVLICLADHPLVLSSSLRRIMEEHAAHPDAIVVPHHGGKRGHPTLFPREVLREIPAGRTLRDLLHDHAARIRMLRIDDPGILLDMDTPAEYDEVRRRTGEASSF
jgi:CTP:molybdopterin cytidylyltransferase MocA